ncbi:MAG: alkaline phosphatase family protein [Anaerolineales bacterium]
MSKVLIVGLDGATFDVIRPLVAQGQAIGKHRLPNLGKMLNEGGWGTLHSTIPPITPAAWTTVFTGKNPGKHGIFDFGEFDPVTYARKPVNVDRHREKTIWGLLGETGKKSIVIDVPYTYPPKPLDGLMITGFGTPRTPETVFTFPGDLAGQVPVSLKAEIRVALPENRFDRSLAWAEIMEGRRRLLRHLIKEQDWDFFFVVFSITDNLAHVFWAFLEPMHPNYHHPEGARFRNALLEAYEQCDALLGDLMEWAGPDTTTFVMSDHGFGSVYPRQFLFSQLVEGGYLAYKSPPVAASIVRIAQKLALRTYATVPFLREWVKGLRPHNQKAMKTTLRRTGFLPDASAIDYRKSHVLPSNFGLQLWVNDQERFANGLVTATERERLVDSLREYLLAIKDPATQQPVISKVYLGAEVYRGAAAPKGPDLIIEYTNFYSPTQPLAGAQNARLDGSHTIEGVFLAHGPNIVPAPVENASLMDIAPTILYLLGNPVPPDMDGRVLTEIFREAYLNQHPITIGTELARYETTTDGDGEELTPEEEAELEMQLRQLGYL